MNEESKEILKKELVKLFKTAKATQLKFQETPYTDPEDLENANYMILSAEVEMNMVRKLNESLDLKMTNSEVSLKCSS